MERLGPRPVLLLAAVFPAGVAATAFMITEHRVDGPRKHAHEGQRAEQADATDPSCSGKRWNIQEVVMHQHDR